MGTYTDLIWTLTQTCKAISGQPLVPVIPASGRLRQEDCWSLGVWGLRYLSLRKPVPGIASATLLPSPSLLIACHHGKELSMLPSSWVTLVPELGRGRRGAWAEGALSDSGPISKLLKTVQK